MSPEELPGGSHTIAGGRLFSRAEVFLAVAVIGLCSCNTKPRQVSVAECGLSEGVSSQIDIESQGRRVSEASRFYWLFVGTEADVNEFASRFRLSPNQVLMLKGRDSKRNSLRRLGIVATPTRIVVTGGSFVVKEVRVMDKGLFESPEVIGPNVCI